MRRARLQVLERLAESGFEFWADGVRQDIEFARRASDSFVIMEKGRVVAEGPIKSLTDNLMHKHMAV